jgi:head-tail adaptor
MIGRFTEKLGVYQPSRTPDGAGGYEESFVLVNTIWASVTPLEEVYTGLQNNQPVSTNRYVVKTHFRKDIEFTPRLRLLWNSDYQLLIEGIRVVGQRYMMVEFTCTLVQGTYSEIPNDNAVFPYTLPFTLA